MVKSNILTPVLSGVLAVTVAGSGVLYYLDNKDSKDSKKSDGSSNNAVERLTDKVSAAAEKAEKAVKGELDFSYDAKIDLEFGKVLTDKMGFDLKPISLETKTMQKDEKSEADLSVSYDSKSIASLNLFADNEAGIMYLKCPELSDAYLTVSKADLENLLAKAGKGASALGIGTTAMLGAPKPEADYSKIMDMMKDIDFSALEEDFKGYIDAIKDAIPEGESKDNIEGDINGYSYSYEVKTIDVTGQVVLDVLDAVVDKAKNDTLLKDQLVKSGISEQQYDQLINQLSSSVGNMPDAQKNQKIMSVDMYYNDGEEVGFDLNLSGMGQIKLIAINSEDVFAIDLNANIAGNSSAALKGAFNCAYDQINGSMNFNFTQGGKQIVNADVTADKLTSVGENVAGSFKVNVTSDNQNFALAFDSASTEDKMDYSVNFDVNGDNALKVSLKGEKTDATDITIPSGTTFKLDEQGVKDYMASCNVDAFLNHVKEAVGDELFNKFNIPAINGNQIE